MPAALLYILAFVTSCISLAAQTHHVGAGQTYASLTHALVVTRPGDTIMIHEGNYDGGVYIASLQGTAAKRIYIVAAPAATVVSRVAFMPGI